MTPTEIDHEAQKYVQEVFDLFCVNTPTDYVPTEVEKENLNNGLLDLFRKALRGEKVE